VRAMRIVQPGPIAQQPLRLEEIPRPAPGPGQVLLRVRACAVCHTDLHLAEGDVPARQYPVTPGHQVVAGVAGLGQGVDQWQIGDRVGVAWLYSTDRSCAFCRRGEENLCPEARFTGKDVDGGFADFLLAEAAYVLPLPEKLEDRLAAPLLCAGIIGYRSLKAADLQPGETLGLVGFGASAHLAIQVARHWDCRVYVFTRSASHRRLAAELGAEWVGGADQPPPQPLDRAVLFAPSGDLVPPMLEKLRPGGTLAINAIHLTPIPVLEYRLIYGERTLRSVANATHQDGIEFLRLSAELPLRITSVEYPLEQASRALVDLKASAFDGAAVLTP
jgi:alcohol dehydrogenase, propanol-preferring